MKAVALTTLPMARGVNRDGDSQASSLGEAPLGAEALRLEVVHQGWHEGKGDLVLEVAV
jgi:hypothetical protein